MSTALTEAETKIPPPFPNFTKLKLERPSPNVLEVVLNDIKGNNRWNDVLFNEFAKAFRIIPCKYKPNVETYIIILYRIPANPTH